MSGCAPLAAAAAAVTVMLVELDAVGWKRGGEGTAIRKSAGRQAQRSRRSRIAKGDSVFALALAMVIVSRSHSQQIGLARGAHRSALSFEWTLGAVTIRRSCDSVSCRLGAIRTQDQASHWQLNCLHSHLHFCTWQCCCCCCCSALADRKRDISLRTARRSSQPRMPSCTRCAHRLSTPVSCFALTLHLQSRCSSKSATEATEPLAADAVQPCRICRIRPAPAVPLTQLNHERRQR